MESLLDPGFVAVTALALGLGGVVKGAIGLGLPIVTIPALAAFLGVPHALSVIMLPLVVTNVWQIVQHRAHAGAAHGLSRLIATGVLGIAVGTWALVELPTRALSLALAAIVAAYVLINLARPALSLSPKRARRIAPVAGLVGGVLQGATGISAPVTVTFLHALKLSREPFVLAVSTMFLAFALAQSASLAVAGVLDWERLAQGALALLPVALGMRLGAALAARLSREAFERIILAVLAVMAARLAWDGLGL